MRRIDPDKYRRFKLRPDYEKYVGEHRYMLPGEGLGEALKRCAEIEVLSFDEWLEDNNLLEDE